MIKIKTDTRNTNKHTEKGLDLLDKSVKTVGIIESYTISNDGVIITGNARHETISQNFTKEPIVIETDGTEPIIIKRTDIESNTKKFHEASILANTTAHHNYNLDTELIEEIAVEFDIEIEELGVEVEEVEDETFLEAKEDDFDTTPPSVPITVLGDLYEIGEHRLLCGDSTDSDQVAKLMNGQKADMVFTDPPYGMFLDADYSKIHKSGGKKYDNVIGDNEDFTPELINTIFACFDYCKEVFIWGADYFIDLIPNYGKDGSWLVWNKRNSEKKFELNADSDLQKKVTGNSFELCWSKQKHKRLIYHCFWNGSLGEGEHEERTKAQTVIRNHPTQKPVLLFTNIFNDFSKNNDLIADLFLGSGSTMVASHQLKRKCYGMELDPKYCDVIIKRMIKLDDTLTIKRNGIECKNEFI